MPLIESEQFYKKVQQGKLDPVYLLYGEESYLLDQAFSFLKEKALEGVVVDFNSDIFYADDAEASTIKETVELLPMMSPRRLIVVKQADHLKDAEWDILSSLFEKPVESSVFILLAEKLDKRKKSIKKAVESAAVVEFKRPFENQIPQWIKVIAKNYELQLSNECIDYLHHMVGNQLRDIDAEIDKLKAYMGARNNVELNDLIAVVTRTRQDSVFEFTEALGQKDQITALYLLVKLLDNGENEVAIVSLVSRHIRILAQILLGLRDGLSGPKLAAYAGLSPYFLTKYIQQAKKWKISELETFLLLLAETDRNLKSSSLKSELWLDNLVLSAMR